MEHSVLLGEARVISCVHAGAILQELIYTLSLRHSTTVLVPHPNILK